MNTILNYEGFENNLKIARSYLDGVQYVFRFDNNYGASVVKHYGSYGSKEDLWELAVLQFYDEDVWDWDLCYDTKITADVIGYLDNEAVRKLLGRIKEL